MTGVDPRVYELAELFIDDTLLSVVHVLMEKGQMPPDRKTLVNRAAAAMQQAIEDECESIRQELVS